MRKSYATGKRGRTRTRPDDESVERERARARDYYWKHREEVLAKARERRQGNPPPRVLRKPVDVEQSKTRRAERKKSRADANKAWMRKIKLLSGCVDCGYADNAVALQFDHKPGTTKSFNLSSRPNLSRDRLNEEIKKCDVRCANCHAVITERRRVEVG